MGRRGPQPMPSAVREATGNTGKRKINRREPKYNAASAKSPAHLDEPATAIWNEHAPRLIKSGVLTEADVPLFAAYCCMCSDFIRASEGLRQNGDLSGDSISPYLKIRHQAAEKMLKIAAHFGLTPSTRASIQAASDAEKKADGNNILAFFQK